MLTLRSLQGQVSTVKQLLLRTQTCISNCSVAESFGVLEKDQLSQLQKTLLMWGFCVSVTFISTSARVGL